MREPVPGGTAPGWDGGWLLLDTGFNTRADPGCHAPPPISRPAQLPGDPARPGRAARRGAGHGRYRNGRDPRGRGSRTCTSTTAGGLKHFAGRVPVHCQRAELDYGLSPGPGPEQHGVIADRLRRPGPARPGGLADGEHRDRARRPPRSSTAGHTPGHQSFMVQLTNRSAGGGFRLRLRRGQT